MSLKKYISEKISEYLSIYDEPCECENIAPDDSGLINEAQSVVSLNMRYHIEKQLPLCESVFRVGSETYVDLYREARILTEQNIIVLDGNDKWLLENTDIGRYGLYEDELVPLDVPIALNAQELLEEEKKDKKISLGKPKRGGPKKYYVYVKGKGGKIKKVTFGYPGMSAKIGNKKLAQAFAKRHRCSEKKDRTKASYWSCNLTRYASLLGLGKPASRYW
jgi:hypothetical protein